MQHRTVAPGHRETPLAPGSSWEHQFAERVGIGDIPALPPSEHVMQSVCFSSYPVVALQLGMFPDELVRSVQPALAERAGRQ